MTIYATFLQYPWQDTNPPRRGKEMRMKTSYMLLKDGITIQSFPTRKEAEATAKEWQEYHADGRKYVIEERKNPETIRDIVALCGVAANDRKLTVNGKPFRMARTDAGDINLVEV